MLSVQTKAAGNVVLNSSILDYYHVDLQISILTLKKSLEVICGVTFKIFIYYGTHHTFQLPMVNT